jgi:hypothetical protein
MGARVEGFAITRKVLSMQTATEPSNKKDSGEYLHGRPRKEAGHMSVERRLRLGFTCRQKGEKMPRYIRENKRPVPSAHICSHNLLI